MDNMDNTKLGLDAPVDKVNNAFDDLPDEFEIIGVSFRNSGKIYYFDAAGSKATDSSHAIVETARGLEYGRVALPNKMVSKKSLVLPLKKVLRIANKDDDEHFRANLKKEDEAFGIAQRKIESHKLDMKLIDAEYTFDNTKLIFYFSAEERVDFRELVKDLAGVFHTRIELRQIGIRDEAKMMGGIGVCGREFCCSTFLSDFTQVSIKMAKEQNLSLNSTKISGVCGRLMCCLRYESDVYQEEIRKTPKVDSFVTTPDGTGRVVSTSPLAGLVRVLLDSDPEGTPRVYDRALTAPKLKTDESPRTPNAQNAQNPANGQNPQRRTGRVQRVLRVVEEDKNDPKTDGSEKIIPRREEKS